MDDPIKLVAMIIAIILLNVFSHYFGFESVVIGLLSYIAIFKN
jgi:hypothetical protein